MLILRLRRLRALRRGQQRAAFRGTLIGVTVMTFAVTGSLIQASSSSGVAVAGVGVVTCALLVAVYFFTPWPRVRRITLLALPAIWLGGLLMLSSLLDGFASNFVGLPVLAFLFGGITQPRWHTLWLLVIAIPTWLVMVSDAGGSTSLWIRFPIVLVLWIAAAELVTDHTSSINDEMRQLRREVDLDQLTGLANRRVLSEVLRDTRPGDALLLLDLDHFKNINDIHGHATGDSVLQQFSLMIGRCLRVDDTALRFGGEEILIVMRRPGCAGAHRFDRQLRREICAIEPSITYSAGVAVITDPESASEALARADKSLYESKQAGRDRTAGDLFPSSSPD